MEQKKLKILIANNTFSLLAGSETWSYTLALALKKAGHLVSGFSPELGIIANKLRDEDVACYNQISTSGVKPFSFVLEERAEHDYDIIIANHWHIVEMLRKEFPKTPIISTIHGIIHKLDDGSPAPEHPSLKANVNQFIAVSEEVQELLRKDYGLESIIIRNFFDVNRFKAKRSISKKPEYILINSNYSDPNDEEIKVLREVAKHYGAKLIALGQNFTQSFETIQLIEKADIIIGMGRSVLEGVCAGRIGIVHGRWGSGGVVNEENIEDLKRFNFSGRNSKGTYWTAEEFIEQIDKNYNQKTVDWGMDYIRREHNATFAAETFIQIAKGLLNKTIEQDPSDGRRPYRRAKDVK